MAVLNLWLAICKARGGTQDARHWILILAEKDAQTGTWYHSTGGPTQGKAYKVEITTKRVASHGIEIHHLIGEISSSEKNKVKASVQKISAKFCQSWVVDVLTDLEKKGIVAGGTSATWADAMEIDPYAEGEDAAESSSSANDSEWVWDEAAGRYKRWDSATQQWIWS